MSIAVSSCVSKLNKVHLNKIEKENEQNTYETLLKALNQYNKGKLYISHRKFSKLSPHLEMIGSSAPDTITQTLQLLRKKGILTELNNFNFNCPVFEMLCSDEKQVSTTILSCLSNRYLMALRSDKLHNISSKIPFTSKVVALLIKYLNTGKKPYVEIDLGDLFALYHLSVMTLELQLKDLCRADIAYRASSSPNLKELQRFLTLFYNNFPNSDYNESLQKEIDCLEKLALKDYLNSQAIAHEEESEGISLSAERLDLFSSSEPLSIFLRQFVKGFYLPKSGFKSPSNFAHLFSLLSLEHRSLIKKLKCSTNQLLDLEKMIASSPQLEVIEVDATKKLFDLTGKCTPSTPKSFDDFISWAQKSQLIKSYPNKKFIFKIKAPLPELNLPSNIQLIVQL